MAVFYVLVWILGAGLLGGLLNAYFAEEGLILPRYDTLPGGQRILRPGFINLRTVGVYPRTLKICRTQDKKL